LFSDNYLKKWYLLPPGDDGRRFPAARLEG
jgi:hypothetical protein